MQILVKVGNQYLPNHKCHYNGWRDGQIIDFRPDGFYKAKMMRKHFCVIETQHDYWNLRGTEDWKSTNQLVLELKKYMYAMDNGKLPWEQGFSISKTKSRTRDYFVDFKKLYDSKWINKTEFESIYDKSKDHNPIYFDRDITSYILHEDSYTRLDSEFSDKLGSISTGTFYIGSDVGDDYSSWSSAVADIVDLTGDLSLLGARDEEVTETTAVSLGGFDCGAHTTVLGVTDGEQHNGSYGSGHRINFDAFDHFAIDEWESGDNNDITIQNIAVDSRGTNGGVNFLDCGGTTACVLEKCLFVCDSDSRDIVSIASWAYAGNIVIRNNIICGASAKDGIDIYSDTASNYYIYNNTIAKCLNGIKTNQNTPIIDCRNNLCQGNGTDFVGKHFDTTGFNISEDDTSPDAGYAEVDVHAVFTDYDNNDYTLQSTDSTLDDGADLSASFTDDIIGTTRSTWFIGAFEYSEGGGEEPSAGIKLMLGF